MAGVRAGTQAWPYVALAGVAGLLALLCCYTCYYFLSKVRELTAADSPPPAGAPKQRSAYPVQPAVREGATSLVAALSRQHAVHPAPDSAAD